MLSPDDIAARTARAVTAASAAGRRLGLRVEDPRVLYDVFSVIVHLAPSPVVVRVPTVLPPSYVEDPETQTVQQHSELAVTGWLADCGYPVVPPSPLVPREPVRREGFSMTFWQFVEEVPDGAEPDYVARIAETARLHAALRDYVDDSLGFWTPFRVFIPDGLATLERFPDLLAGRDLARARREWAAVAPYLTSRAAFESAFPGVEVQPIHGDAPYHNMIATPAGELWSDFELVTLGPVECDVAFSGPGVVAAYDDAARRLGMRTLDPGVRRLTAVASALSGIACLAMAPELPMLVDAMTPAVDAWRAGPEFTEL